jgi:quercetin dioxygenase-like cupin family protein
MNNEQYVKLVNQNEFPESVSVPIDPNYTDDRGSITNVWLGQSGSVTVITSKKGSIRARHTHTDDWHSFYMVSGKVQYTEKDANGNTIHGQIYQAGEAFFSRPDVWHEMVFLEDSIGVTCNGIVKNHENYEKTVKRQDL